MTLVAGSVSVALFDPPTLELQLRDEDGTIIATATFEIEQARAVAADILKLCNHSEVGAAIGPAQGSA